MEGSLIVLPGCKPGISPTQHETLRQAIHFIDNGPGDGFASGAYRVNIGGAFPTAIIWYLDTTMTQKLVSKDITYSNNVFPTTIQWQVYQPDGITVAHTVIDTIEYDYPFEINRTREII
jgi:hypothetical protein